LEGNYLALASAATSKPLSDITTVSGTATVTSAYPIGTDTPVIASVTYPATYDDSVFPVAAFSATGTGGTFVGNNTVSSAALTFTSGSDSTTVLLFATVTGNTFTVTSVGYPKFLTTGTYSASLKISAVGGVYSVTPTTALASITTTLYAPLTISASSFVNPQAGSTTLNGSITFAPTTRVGSSATVFLSPSTVATSGVAYYASATIVTGVADFNTGSSIVNAVGGLVSGVWVPAIPNTAGATLLAAGATYGISARVTESGARGGGYAAGTANLQASVVLSAGSTDVTVPVCTAATVLPATLSTVNGLSNPLVFTITCTDSGSGLFTSGAFLAITTTSGNGGSQTEVVTVTGGTYSLNVPNYVSGSLNIVGVFAVDNAGNAVVYGNCGGAVGYDSLGCASGGGGGSSSASAIAMSLFAVVFLAISALFA